MAERINLAQFDIDTRSLEEKIARNQTGIDILKGEIRDTRKALKEYQDQAKLLAGIIVEGNDALEIANQELQQGIITQEQYNYIVDLTSDVIRESEQELSRLIETEHEQQRQLVRYQADLTAVNEENRELNRLLRAGREEITGNEGAYSDLSQQLSAARQEANNLGAELAVLRQNGQRNTPQYEELNRTWQESAQRARELHEELLEIDRATGDNRRNVGNYTESIKEAFEGMGTGFAQIMSGNVIQGFETLKKGFGDVKESAKELWIELMANPLVAIAAAIAAIGVGLYNGAKAVFEYNAEVSKLNKEVEGLTNLAGAAVDRIREYATGLEKVFGRDFQDSVKEISSLMKDFGLTSEQAFNLYNEGLAKGGALNSEFGDSINEYGVLFAQNGYSAEEFLNLLNAGIDLDVYQDKLPDAIKELGISLTDTTKSVRDSLVNAFGATFADDLLRRVNSGKITIKQALDEISAETQKNGLNLQQIANLNASVFRGAGEDAGGLAEIINAVNLANDKNAQTLTKSQEATIKLTEANVELEKAKTKALKSDEVQALTTQYDLLTTQIETGFYKVIERLREGVTWFDNVTGVSTLFIDTWNAGVEYVKSIGSAFDTLFGVVKDLTAAFGLNNSQSDSLIKTIVKFINPITYLKFAYQGLTGFIKFFSAAVESSRVTITAFAITAKSLFSQVIDVFKSIVTLDIDGAINKLKNISISRELATAYKEAQKIVALNKQAKQDAKEEVVTNDTKIKNNNKDTGASADAAAKAAAERQKLLDKQQKEADKKRKEAEKAAEDAAKQDLANAKERANIAIQATQAELAEYIAMNAEKLKSDKRLTQARVNEIKEYLDKVKEETLKANELERQQKLKSLDEQIAAIKGVNQQELDQKKNLEDQKQVIRKEYDTKEIQIVNESYDKQKELDKNFLEQKREMRDLARALEYQKQISDLETQGYTEFEMQKVQLDQQVEQRLASFLAENELKRQLDQENYDLNAEIEAQRRELENQIALEQDEIKKQNLQNLLSSLNLIQQDYAVKEAKIAQEKELSKWALASSVAMGMAKVAGEQTKAGKALAIAGATIDTIAGSVRALRDYPAPYSFILMGTTIAAGLAQVAKIAGVDTGGAESGLAGINQAISAYAPKKTTVKAADGMLIGPSHDNGGIPIKTPDGMIEAEGGEIIINKKSSAMYRDVLSQINQIGGGVRFASGGMVPGINISKLPTVQNSIKNGIDLNLMSEMISSAVLEGSALGTQMGSQQGIIGLSENRQIQQGANF